MGWDPKTYLAYGAERTRPAADLLARVPLERPRRVADLGCGPANSTALLRARWPDAEIDAIDFAPEMLADARKSAELAARQAPPPQGQRSVHRIAECRRALRG